MIMERSSGMMSFAWKVVFLLEYAVCSFLSSAANTAVSGCCILMKRVWKLSVRCSPLYRKKELYKRLVPREVWFSDNFEYLLRSRQHLHIF